SGHSRGASGVLSRWRLPGPRLQGQIGNGATPTLTVYNPSSFGPPCCLTILTLKVSRCRKGQMPVTLVSSEYSINQINSAAISTSYPNLSMLDLVGLTCRRSIQSRRFSASSLYEE